MPTTPPVLRALVDDAAVFPPGNATLADAVARHAEHREAWYADCVGPLLVPVAAADDLVRVLDERDAVASPDASGPLDLVLVSRPGTDRAALVPTLAAARAALVDDGRVRLVGAELGWYDQWCDDLAGQLPLAVEAPRGPDGDHAVEQVRDAHREGLPVVAKFRTGPTPAWAWPDEAELATFLRITAPEVPFKLTGGLHHAVRGTYEVAGVPEENHGVLNVLVATRVATMGAAAPDVAVVLAQRNPGPLVEMAQAWDDETSADVRRAFRSFGCCEVTDPLGDLAALGVLEDVR